MNDEKSVTASQTGWGFAWRIARREIRGSLNKFRVFLGALMLGVAAIGTVGSVADSMRSGISNNARVLLGGDIEFSSLHTPPDRKSTRLNSSHSQQSRMPSSA